MKTRWPAARSSLCFSSDPTSTLSRPTGYGARSIFLGMPTLTLPRYAGTAACRRRIAVHTFSCGQNCYNAPSPNTPTPTSAASAAFAASATGTSAPKVGAQYVGHHGGPPGHVFAAKFARSRIRGPPSRGGITCRRHQAGGIDLARHFCAAKVSLLMLRCWSAEAHSGLPLLTPPRQDRRCCHCDLLDRGCRRL